MAKRTQDPETGITAKATDGVPDDPAAAEMDNEVKRRRELKEARERAEEAAVTGGRTIDDQPPEEPASEAEMFPAGSIQGDHKVTMKNIVPANAARKTEAKMGATAIPLRDGLVRYGELVELLVTVEAGKVEEVPDLEEPEAGGQRVLHGVKDVQRFRPVHVRSAASMFTLEQVLDILEMHFGITRSADKIAEVFGLERPQVAAG